MPRLPRPLLPLLALPLLSAGPSADVVAAVGEVALSAPDGATGDAFGAALDLDPGWLAVGAPGRVDPSGAQGAVYLWRRTPAGLAYETRLVPGDGGPGDGFGSSVAVADGRLAVGAPGHGSTGKVYVFASGAGGWTLAETLLPEGSVSGAPSFGSSVAVSADRVAGVGQTDNGVWGVFVFVAGPGGSTLEDTLVPTTGLPSGFSFVDDVALAGDVLVSGAANDFDPSFTSTGNASIYRRSGASWTLEDRFYGTEASWFGAAVDLDGEQVAVGARYGDVGGLAAGTATVLGRAGGTWSVDATLAPPAPAADDVFGGAVALDGPLLAVGGRNESSLGDQAGAVWLFARSAGWPAPGTWSLCDVVHAADAAAGDRHGTDVALLGRSLAVGAPRTGPGGGAGTVRAYDLVVQPGVGACFPDPGACPCGNDPAVAEGCTSSRGRGVWLSGAGSTSVAADDLALVAHLCPAGNAGLFLAGTETAAAPTPFFDGLQCVGGDTRRYRPLFQTSGTATDTGFAAQSPGYLVPGTSYRLQYWTRDAAAPSPCGSGANFSSAYLVTAAP